jgi:hypothetical protein
MNFQTVPQNPWLRVGPIMVFAISSVGPNFFLSSFAIFFGPLY